MTTLYDLPLPGRLALERSQALSEAIKHEIIQHDGVISFMHFMQWALYHPQWGYYSAPEFTLGKQGDFITAPEMSPLFSRCFANQARQILEHIGQGNILELGAGTGRFAHDFLLQLEHWGTLPQQYFIYEISATLRNKQRDFLQSHCPTLCSRITWLDTLPTDFVGVIIANEVLDALPFHCFIIQDDAVKERAVAIENDHFCWHIRSPISDELKAKGENIREQYALSNEYASEINLALPGFIQSVANSIKQGVILLADYGYGQAEYYHPDRRQGTLTCFYQHNQLNNPFHYPGLLDITAHVDFTSVITEAVQYDCTLAGFTSQAGFLLDCGLIEQIAHEEKKLSSAQTVNLHHAVKLLTLPTEMGERVKVMALGKNIDLPLLGFRLQNRRRDL